MMKIRILNAGHQILANAGEVLSVPTIADCMAHPRIGAFFRKLAAVEIAPHVASVPGMAVADYVDLIATRFSNPAIVDTTRRVAFDGLGRHTGFVLPVIHDALAAEAPVEGLALVEAAWARMCAGTREDGSEIAPNDPAWDRLVPVAQAARNDPMAWLKQTHIYGDLAAHPRLAGAFTAALTAIWRDGMDAALAAYLAR